MPSDNKQIKIKDSFAYFADRLEERAKDLFSSTKGKEDSIFEEKPVDLETFLYAENFLHLRTRLSKPQFDLVSRGTDILDKPASYTEIVTMVGQGGGKDFISAIIVARTIYLLLCLKSPQTYYNLAWSSAIHIINVAPNANLAKEVFFKYLTELVDKTPIFQELGAYDYYSGRPAPSYTKSLRTIEFRKKNIIAVSGNSEEESWQGYNPIIVILDEIDAFKSKEETGMRLRPTGAEGVYDAARLLVQSRFPNIGKVILLSWPRYHGSFIMQRFEKGKSENNTYVICKSDGSPFSTWEFNPLRSKEEFAEEYIKNPELAKARLECSPALSESPFFPIPDVILEAFDGKMIGRGQVGPAGNREIIEEPISEDPPQWKRYIHCDLAVRHNRAALALAHKDDMDIVYVDIIKVWEAQDGREIQFRDILDYIYKLHDQFVIGKVTFDGFQSVAVIQELNQKGIRAEHQSVDKTRKAYDTLKERLNTRKIIGSYYHLLIKELLGLTLYKGDKIVPRSSKEKKDTADALAGAVRLASEETNQVGSAIEVITINKIFPDHAPSSESPNSMSFLTTSIEGNPKKEICEICRIIGGIEKTETTKRCLACRAEWVKDEKGWMLTREPDKKKLEEIRAMIRV